MQHGFDTSAPYMVRSQSHVSRRYTAGTYLPKLWKLGELAEQQGNDHRHERRSFDSARLEEVTRQRVSPNLVLILSRVAHLK